MSTTIPSRRLDGHRKPAVLAVGAIMSLALAIEALVSPGEWMPEVATFHYWLPVPIRVGGWLVGGIGALVGVVWRRWHPIAWGLLMLMPVQRAVSYGWSTIMWLIPGWPPGALESALSAVFWAGIAGVIHLVATWPEPQPREAA